MLTHDALHALPKIDLHRHLEGSLRLETLSDIAHTHGLDILDLTAGDIEKLRPFVQITDDPQHPEPFLAKFNVLRHFYRSPEAVARLTYEAIVDAAADNVRYLELRFSPQALARVQGFNLAEVTDWVIEATQQASRVCQIKVSLIVTLVRHEPLEQAWDVARVAFERAGCGIAGIDLAGDENKYPAQPFSEIFREAQKCGLGITVHAGEWQGTHSVESALNELYAVRIGHGVRVVDDAALLERVRRQRVALEMCLTSNLQTGAVSDIGEHPLSTMLRTGCLVTLNTDDPSVSNCTLTDEFEIAIRQLGLSFSQLRQLTMNAARAAFLSPDEKQALIAEFTLLWDDAERIHAPRLHAPMRPKRGQPAYSLAT